MPPVRGGKSFVTSNVRRTGWDPTLLLGARPPEHDRSPMRPRQVSIGDLGLTNHDQSWYGRRRTEHALANTGRTANSAVPGRKACQPTRCPTGFGPAPLTEVMYTGRDSVEAWITWPPPMYIAT